MEHQILALGKRAENAKKLLMRSLGFEVALFPYESIVSAFGWFQHVRTWCLTFIPAGYSLGGNAKSGGQVALCKTLPGLLEQRQRAELQRRP